VALGLNLSTALENVANHTGGVRDVRTQQGTAKRKAEERIKELKAQMAAQAKIAGTDTVAKIDADISEKQISDAKRWKASNECNVMKVTRDETVEFCRGVNSLRAKRAAAVERDSLDAKIEAQWLIADAPAPSVADPGVEQIVSIMKLGGTVDDERSRTNAAFLQDLKKAAGLELLASVWPFVVGLTFSFLPKAAAAKKEEVEPEAEVVELNAKKIARTIGQEMPVKDRALVALFKLVREGDTGGRFQSRLALCRKLPGEKKVYTWLPEWQEEGLVLIEGGSNQPVSISFTRDGLKKVERMYKIKYV
jgi:hypothetical protein